MARSSMLWRSLAIGGSLALVLSACGSDDDGDDQAAETTEATEEASGGSATGDGTLTVGTLLPETGSLSLLQGPAAAKKS